MQRPNTGGRYIRDPKTKKLTRADDVKPATKASAPAAEEPSTMGAAEAETNGDKPDTKGK